MGILIAIVLTATFLIRNQVINNDERRQDFENNLLIKIIENHKIVIHNQGIIIKNDVVAVHNHGLITHNQQQFAKYGFGNPAINYTTPNIRTDIWNSSTDYWQNYTR